MLSQKRDYNRQREKLKIQQAEREAKENQLKSVEARINELNEYKESLAKELKALTPSEASK